MREPIFTLITDDGNAYVVERMPYMDAYAASKPLVLCNQANKDEVLKVLGAFVDVVLRERGKR